jgi:hypothetical protein
MEINVKKTVGIDRNMFDFIELIIEKYITLFQFRSSFPSYFPRNSHYHFLPTNSNPFYSVIAYTASLRNTLILIPCMLDDVKNKKNVFSGSVEAELKYCLRPSLPS